MTDSTVSHDKLDDHDRIYLEKLRLAATVILDLAEDPGAVSDILATELYLFRDRVDRALLLPEAAAAMLPWRDKPAT